MQDTLGYEPHRPRIEEPAELEPDDLPEPPDETLVPTHIPEDPERGRLVDPEDREPMKAGRRGCWGYTLV